MRTRNYYNNISYVIDRYIPQNIKDNYPLYYNFIETYYEYLQQNNQFVAYNMVKSIQDWNDVDTTLDDFIDYFKKEYINLPLEDDWGLYIKHYKEIYASKGSTKSLEFFIKLLTGLNVEVYYPNRYLMKSSDGIYRSYTIIFCERDNNINYNDYISTRVHGGLSLATGIIEKIEIYDTYVKIFLSSVNGEFNNEPIFFNNGAEFKTNIVNVLSGIKIIENGNNYTVDDNITISNYSNVKAKIESIYSGSLDKINIINGGVGYQEGDILNFVCDKTEEYFSLPVVRVTDVVLPIWDYTYDITLVDGGKGYEIGDILSYNDIHIEVTEVDELNFNKIKSFEIISNLGYLDINGEIELEDGTGDEASFYITSTRTTLHNPNEVGKILNVKILNPGYGLLTVPTLVDITTSNGTGAEFEVISEKAGGIRSISIYYPECNITELPNLIIDSLTGTNAIIEPVISYQYQEMPYYYQAGSFLSDIFKLQDSYYWQEYSYVLNVTGSVLEKYKDIFKSLLHPAGYAFFTNTELINYIDLSKRYVDSIISTGNIIDINHDKGQYIELLHYKDRIINDTVIYPYRKNEIVGISEETIKSKQNIGGSFVSSSLEIYPPQRKFTINVTPSNATVIINGKETKSVNASQGDTIKYSVNLDGYIGKSNVITLNEDTILDITLVQITNIPLTTNFLIDKNDNVVEFADETYLVSSDNGGIGNYKF